MIITIAAVDSKNGIGKNNQLPWKFKKDMSFFKTQTTGNSNNAVIMGRKTWESLPKALPDRMNIVISKNLRTDEAMVFSDFSKAISFTKKEYENTFIIGGHAIYDLGLQVSDQLLITHIYKTFDCDVFFPDYSDWHKQTQIAMAFEDNTVLDFWLYEKGK